MLKVILEIIGERQSSKSKTLFLLMLVSMLLETVGIGLVLPFIDIVDKGHLSVIVQSNYTPAWVSSLSHEEIIVVSLIFLVVFFILKNIFLAFMSWYRAHFLGLVQGDVSRRLFDGYLSMPYSFHLEKNTAHLIRSVRDESTHLIGGLDHFIEILTQTLVLLGIVAFLIWVEPVGGVVVFFILGVAGIVFHKITKNKLAEWGEENLYREGLRLQHLQQGLNGIKDVKVFRKEREFLEKFDVNNVLFLNTNMKHKFLSSLPRLWFEFLAISGIALLTLSILIQDKTIELLVSILAVYAAAAFRIMPNVNNILVGLQGVQFAKENINNVYKSFLEIGEKADTSYASALSFNKAIEFRNVCYGYKKTENLILKDVNLEIRKGDMVGIIGPSGSGKSTLVDILIGLLSVEQGGVFVDDVNINSNIRGWMRKIGYVSQNIYLVDGTIQENIAFGIHKDEVNEESVERVLELANLEEFVSSLPNGVSTMVGENGSNLSGGQRQRIAIARSLYHDPDLIVLDEATSALDKKTEQSIMKAAARINKTKTIVLITHNPSILSDCKQVYEMKDRSLRKIEI